MANDTRAPAARPRTLGYVRVSTGEQTLSLAAQREKLEGYAGLYDLDLIAVIEDAGQSGKTLDRPGLQQALALLAAGAADALLIAKLDRLVRHVGLLGKLVERYFAPGQAALLSVGDQIDTRTASGRLVLNVLGSVGQWEREIIVERTTEALRHKKRAGAVYGTVPLGFDRVGDRLVPNAAEQRVIARIRRARAAGESLQAIAGALNRDRVPTKTGKSWYASTIKALLNNDLHHVMTEGTRAAE